MIWVWRGKGAWALWSLMAGTLVLVLILEATGMTGERSPAREHAWPVMLILLLAAGICLWIGKDNYEERNVVDSTTGLQTTQRVRHSFYWIPIEYWGGLYIAIAFACLLFERF